MKISLNWCQDYSNVELSKIGQEKLIEKIGAQLGAVDEVIEWGKRYDGIVVVKVTECVKHPSADKLHVCKIDDGKALKNVERDSKGLVQVVCGAPNVKAGMLAAWIPPGTAVPSSLDKEPLVLDAREIRGEISNGMLASLSELGIGSDHSGILAIAEKEAKPGLPLKKLYGLDDLIIDVENKMFTHRPDCFGHLGVARELAGIQQLRFKSPDWYLKSSSKEQVASSKDLALKVRVEDKKLVPRFVAAAFKGVEITPSPTWLQAYLSRVGIRPINNIVDLTNYHMLLTGQPLHAYDYDKLKAASLETRNSRKGEKLKLLNGKTIQFDDDATVLITSGDVPVGIGGVMGGAETEVDESTKNIVLECASFDMYSIRRTSMKYGLFTDAVTRFNKGQSPLQNDKVLSRLAEDVVRIAGGEAASKVVDVKGKVEEPASVAVTAEFINERLGTSLSLKEIAKLLENVEFVIKTVPADKNRLHVKPPFWRTDIEIPEDIVEEVGRLYGYDHLPLELPRRDITPAPKDELLELKAKVRDILADAGANEVLTYSFVHGNLLDKCGQDKKLAFKLSNALSPDLQYYRLSLVPSLLEKVYPNIKAGAGEFALFEIGKSHIKGLADEAEGDVPAEAERVALIFANTDETQTPAYYRAKIYAEELLSELNIETSFTAGNEHKPSSDEAKQTWAPFAPERTAYIKTADGEPLGMVGEFSPAVRRSLKLSAQTAGFEFNLTQLLNSAGGEGYKPLPRFPKVEQDITLKVPADMAYGELYEFIKQALDESKPEHTEASLTPLSIYQSETDKEHKNATFHYSIASHQKTMTAEEVNLLLDEAAAAAHEKFGAERL